MHTTQLMAGLVTLGLVLARHDSKAADFRVMRVPVTVTNDNPLDVDVFVVVGGSRIRLGTVVTSQTREFELPSQAVGTSQVRIAADPVGSRDTWVSPPLSVSEGQQVRLHVGSRLPQSTAVVEAAS